MSKAFLMVSPPRARDRLEVILRRVLWGAIIALVVFAAGVLCFQLFVSPNLLVQRIEIKSDLALSQEEVLALGGLKSNEYFFAVDARALEGRLESHPLVKEAIVEKVFPETLKLTLVGRRPLVVAYGTAGGRSVPLVFDEDGILFERGERAAARDLPVLSGAGLAEAGPGTALAKTWRPFLKDLENLKQGHAPLYALISEIRVVSLASGSYELILYPLSFPVKVWIGKRLNAGALRYLFYTLYFMEKQGLLEGLDEVDFRSGEAVYRRKGEQ